MNKKRGPVSYSTYQEAKDRINELEQRLLVEETHGEKYRDRIAMLEGQELGFMKTSLEYKRRIALLEAVAEEAEMLVMADNKADNYVDFTDLEQYLYAAGYLKEQDYSNQQVPS
jgi:hypothetical protein